MMINVAINGFGRIGKMVLRAGWNDKKINFIAINDLTDTKTLAYLLQNDSAQGKFAEKVTFTKDSLTIGKKKIPVFTEKDPSKLPWKKLKVDVVVESTGFFTKPEGAALHLKAGAKKVLLSAPCKCEQKVCPTNVKTLVMGVNNGEYKKNKHHIISNASCTTNCVAPLLKIIQNNFGIKNCFFSTIHAYTSTQRLVDGPNKKLRRCRAAAVNIIPSTTGADVATAKVIPKLVGKIKGIAFRVPIVDGSVTDFSIETVKSVTAEKVNQLIKKMAQTKFKNIVEYSEKELVSDDIIHNPHSSIFDSKLTHVQGKNHLKLVSWYDNEWGYSSRMVDMIKFIS
ncbi:MAG: type I glyceraldehyde-3-phosphate dehydrogenase [Nanoarchaeota archaeon]|nr:type I glyceraldehyde-3-phosphate dehydrogenase [Nanoarchaeota archaeon]